jgi:hypothetical protein
MKISAQTADIKKSHSLVITTCSVVDPDLVADPKPFGDGEDTEPTLLIEKEERFERRSYSSLRTYKLSWVSYLHPYSM